MSLHSCSSICTSHPVHGFPQSTANPKQFLRIFLQGLKHEQCLSSESNLIVLLAVLSFLALQGASASQWTYLHPEKRKQSYSHIREGSDYTRRGHLLTNSRGRSSFSLARGSFRAFQKSLHSLHPLIRALAVYQNNILRLKPNSGARAMNTGKLTLLLYRADLLYTQIYQQCLCLYTVIVQLLSNRVCSAAIKLAQIRW